MIIYPPFLKIFLDKNVDDSVVIHLKNNNVLPEPILPCSVDYFITDLLHSNIDKICKALKSDGKVVLFYENSLSYLNIKKNIFNFLRIRQTANYHLLEKNNFKRQVKFRCDGQLQGLYWEKQISSTFIPPLFAGKEKLKIWLFKNKYFQHFMPYCGIVFSKTPFHNYLYNDLIKEIGSFVSNRTLFNCFNSKTGIIIFEFQDIIVRLGITPIGNRRVKDNNDNLNCVSKYIPKKLNKKIPKILKLNKIGRNYYCVETKINGVEANNFINNPELIKVMTIRAADFLIELTKNTSKRVQVNQEFLNRFLVNPLNIIRSFIKKPEFIKALKDIEDIIAKIIINEQIPMVLSHGDYKLENMRFHHPSNSLAGIFDWDMASKSWLPCYDLYNLFVSNEILIHDCSYEEAFKRKLFPCQLLDWEKKILWNYYESIKLSSKIERHIAFLYWACRTSRETIYKDSAIKTNPDTPATERVSSVIILFRKDLLEKKSIW